MNVVHLYLRPGPDSSLNVLRSTFAVTHSFSKETVAQESISDWLTEQLADSEVVAIYNCAGTGITCPEGCPKGWAELPAGHPIERQ